MKIIKKTQSLLKGLILNTKTSSDSDTYSCNYINSVESKIPKIAYNVTDENTDKAASSYNVSLIYANLESLMTAVMNLKIPKVIDNLTSSSTTDALSAKQGKDLTSMISYLNTEVSLLNNTVDKLSDAVTIGWSNSNPSNQFVEQTITLNTSDYDYYEIIFSLTSTNYKTTASTGKIQRGYNGYLNYVGGTGQLTGFSRNTLVEADNKIKFESAIRANTGATENDRCIPQKVILYKIGR